MHITYKKRRSYKYTLLEQVQYQTGIQATHTHDVVAIDDGLLTIKPGYAWDGPSGPAFDTGNFLRGSLVHDALYQLMREGVIPQAQREKADQILYDICRADGMSKLRAKWVFWAVRKFAGKAAQPDILTAP